MEIRNQLRFPAPPDEVFATLLDVDGIATCIPGVALDPADGAAMRRGRMDVKVGMMRFGYRGQFGIVEQDGGQRRAVIQGEGEESRGQGTVRSTITMTVVPEGAQSRVDVVTDLNLTGAVLQFGQGMIEEFAQEIMDDFATCLRQRRWGPAAPAAATAGASASARASAPRQLNIFAVLLGVFKRRLRRLFRST
ncbi:MAG TPA: SRPBCC family protein [Ramlibacter sp.]|nr:SRPBCC family protein [Ramlibacter sp.]